VPFQWDVTNLAFELSPGFPDLALPLAHVRVNLVTVVQVVPDRGVDVGQE